MKLSDHERLVFAGLVRAMTRQDGVVTGEEAATVKDLAELIGPEDFWRAMSQAQEEMPGPGDVSSAAAAITRPEARRWMFERLEELAAADEIVVAEEALLHWLVRIWSLD